GWAAYYRGVVSSRTFGELDNYLWKLTWRWAKRSHSGKPKRWVAHRYFGRFNKFRNDRWVFGNRTGADERGSIPHLIKFAWTPIVRHQGDPQSRSSRSVRCWVMRRDCGVLGG
ncbi:MAG: group II intron maturase-specific domain-containing protein, partial [Pseudonocardiaceae bacterium]